jgi:hypothetical protein
VRGEEKRKKNWLAQLCLLPVRGQSSIAKLKGSQIKLGHAMKLEHAKKKTH